MDHNNKEKTRKKKLILEKKTGFEGKTLGKQKPTPQNSGKKQSLQDSCAYKTKSQ